MSWNSRMEKAARPWRLVSSCLSPRSCKAKAVEDRDRIKPTTRASVHVSPRSAAGRTQGRGCDQDLESAEADDGLSHDPQAFRLQFQADDEQQQHDPEFGEMQNLVHVAHQAQPRRPDGGPGSQVAQHGAQPDSLEYRHQKDRGEQKQRRLFDKTQSDTPSTLQTGL